MDRKIIVFFILLSIWLAGCQIQDEENEIRFLFLENESDRGVSGYVLNNNKAVGYAEDGKVTLPLNKISPGNISLVENNNHTSHFSIRQGDFIHEEITFIVANDSENKTGKIKDTKVNTSTESDDTIEKVKYTEKKEISLKYCREGVIGSREELRFEVYPELNEMLAAKERSIEYYPEIEEPPTRKDFLMKFLNHSQQRREIKKLAKKIETISDNKQEEVRITTTLVQFLPYDDDALVNESHKERYPYEVIYDQKGICGEKSKLIIAVLRELGFGTAYIIFPEENHAVAGISCETEYSFRNSGYCFIESTEGTQIGQSDKSYVDVGKLESTPVIIPVSEGAQYEDIEKIFENAYEELENGTRTKLTNKYGNVILRVNGDYWNKVNNPDIIISYGNTSYNLVE